MAGLDYSQFKGKPFQVISKLGVRYTGIFDHISQEDQTICLGQVYNHGTEDRPTPRKLPGSTNTLGWVRFHTASIESLALVENYVPPGQEAPVDPILASVSQTAPPAAASSAPPSASGSGPPPVSSQPTQQPYPTPQSQRYNLPAKPVDAISAAAAVDRVQASFGDLSVDQPRRRGSRPQAPEVPDAEFDFSKGNETLQKDRDARRGSTKADADGSQEVGDLEQPPHPSLIANGNSGLAYIQPQTDGAEAGKKSSSVYQKNSFFDGLSGESSRISRNEERHRNFDTFGEAGGSDVQGQQGFAGGRGGRGGGGGRGGYYGGGRGGYDRAQGMRQSYDNQDRGYGRQGGQGYRGRGRGGFGQGQGQEEAFQRYRQQQNDGQ